MIAVPGKSRWRHSVTGSLGDGQGNALTNSYQITLCHPPAGRCMVPRAIWTDQCPQPGNQDTMVPSVCPQPPTL